jgi:hypothetical protein
MATDILYANENGIEFWTVTSTGESAVSQRGLSRMCGVQPKAIRYLLGEGRSLLGLETIEEHELYLGEEIVKRFAKIKPIRSKYAAKVIKYYAKQGRDRAWESLECFAAIGIDSYIQGVTGWLPKEKQSSQDSRNEINRLIKDADPWKQLYSAATCDKVRRWYFPRDFFWKFAYDWMTTEEIQFLNNYNPVDAANQQRSNRIHQHLSKETRERLTPEIAGLRVLIESATSRQDFETRYNRAKGYDQKEAF